MTTEEKALRRMLCAARSRLPYMDDGEAQDNEGPICIDYMRDSLEDIEAKWRSNINARILAAEKAKDVEPTGLPYGIIDPDYARIFTIARVVAWQFGYSVSAQGSFTRDLDLLLVPWAERAMIPPDLVIQRICNASGLTVQPGSPSDKPHGRKAWSLLLPGFSEVRWVDVSAFSIPKKVEPPQPLEQLVPPIPRLAPNANMIQWRNIKKVVKQIADHCFGSKDDPTWGVSYISVVNSLTARDGIKPTGLESLYAPEPPVYKLEDLNSPASTSEFQEGQWWVQELDNMVDKTPTEEGSNDFKRAVAVVHHLLRSVRALELYCENRVSTEEGNT